MKTYTCGIALVTNRIIAVLVPVGLKVGVDAKVGEPARLNGENGALG